jgi:molecular chaperone GrpE
MADAEEKEEREATAVTITDLELESLKREAGDYKDKYLRTLAESENLRKRLQKERQEVIQYAIQNVVLDFLHPLDHLENALAYTDDSTDEVKHWAKGFEMILTQFKDALANHSIKPFASQGEMFDPHVHEAIEMIETDEHPPGTIVEEILKGYAIGDRTIRPARVKVAKIEKQEEGEEENE